jgi:uncharacterized LabA/DUF88 family protein
MLKQLVKPPVYVFIDAENLFYCQKTLGWFISYRKLLTYLKEECGDDIKIFVYKGVDESNSKQKKFLDMLTANGFILRTKVIKKINSKKGEKWKGSLDIEMALEIFKLKDKYNTAILVTGDSDFAVILDEVKTAGKRVLVVSTRGHVAKELLERAKYIDLRKLKESLSK